MREPDKNVWFAVKMLLVIAAVFLVPLIAFAGYYIWWLMNGGLGYVPPEHLR